MSGCKSPLDRKFLLKTASSAAILSGALAASAACAQTAATQTSPTTTQQAAPSNGASPVAPEAILQEIVVTGRNPVAGGNMIVQREPETTSSISAKAISQRIALAGPLQLIATTPGVAASQSDPYAMSQRSYLFMRGLPETEIGFLVDGAPAVRQDIFLPYSESWADPENFAGLTVIPGSSRITDPLETAVGGEVIETIRDPSKHFGADASVSYGSYNGQRYFGRLDTGEIGDTGITAFASVSYSQAGTYNLPGDSSRTHVDFKVAKDWGESVGKSSLFVSYNDWNSERQNVYTLSTFAQQQATGNYTIGNYSPTFAPGVSGNNFYKQDYWLMKSVLVAAQNSFDLGNRVTINIDPYYHWTDSNSPGATIVNPSSLYAGNQKVSVNTSGLYLVNGNIPVRSNSLYNEYDAGVNAYARFDLTDSNHLTAGWWYDHWNLASINDLAPLNQNGYAGNNWGGDVLVSTTGKVVAGSDFHIQTDLNAGFISDEQSFLDDKLKLEVGVKYLEERLSGVDLVPGATPNLSASFGRWLPRATISYDIDAKMQIYADVITSARPPIPVNTYPQTYSVTTGHLAQAGQPNTLPEYAVGEEVGYRYHDKFLTADLAAFNKVIDNRQIIASAVVNGAGVSTSLSAGTESIQGVSGELSLHPIYGFTPYINAQYLHAVTDSNFAIDGDYLPTKGKIAPGSPEFTATIGVFYDNGPFFGSLIYRYTGSQYGSLMDDQTLSSRGIVDLGLGYHLPSFAGKNTVIRVDFTNLGDKPYLGEPSGIVANTLATKGLHGTTIPAATATYFEAAPMTVMGTLSAAF